MKYLFPFLVCIFLSLILTPVFRWIAHRFNVVDHPEQTGRKQHGRVVAYLGGLAVGLSFVAGSVYYGNAVDKIGIVMLGLAWVVILGVIDDILKLSPAQKLFGQVLVGLILIFGGIGIESIPLPMGQRIDLLAGGMTIDLGFWQGTIFWLQAFFTMGWTLLLLNALNFLDGVDGLASGVSVIAFMMIFLLSLTDYVNQPDIALLAVMMVGALIGFLPYNLPRASIFLGDGGSMLLGYMLAVLAILSGGKVATLVLVLGLGLIDSLVVIFDRWRQGKKVWQADRAHLHYKLIDAGWSDWQVILMYFFISIVFGLLAVYTPSSLGKMLAWFVLAIYFVLLLLWGVRRYVKK